MSVTGTASYLVINLHAPTGLKQSQTNKVSLRDPRNQLVCAQKEKQRWVWRVLDSLHGTKFLAHIIILSHHDSETGQFLFIKVHP